MIRKSLERKEKLQKIDTNNRLSKKMITVLEKDITDSMVEEVRKEKPEEKVKELITKEEFLNKYK